MSDCRGKTEDTIATDRPSWLDEFERVPGWLDPGEALLLSRLAAEKRPGRVVEIGSYQGRSAIALAKGLQEIAPLLAIDTFRGSPEHWPGGEYFDPQTMDAEGAIDTLPLFRKHIRQFGVEHRVEVWRDDSLSAAGRMIDPVSLLFIDADHAYPSVRRDLGAWLPHLVARGIVVLHDVGDWEGPTRAAADLLSCGFRRLDQVGTALALEAPSQLPLLP